MELHELKNTWTVLNVHNKKCIIMRKMFLLSAKFLLAILICLPLSCNKDDSTNPNNPGNSVPDPEGTVTANISEMTDFEFTDDNLGLGRLAWSRPDNIALCGAWYIGENRCYASICNIGKVNGLGSIKNIPSSGFSTPTFNEWNNSTACEKGHGYVIKFDKRNNGTVKIIYVRLFVVETIISTTGSIMGAKVKYQYPFEP